MPAAVAIIGSVAGVVGGAVAGVASAISGAIGGIVSAVAGAIGGITSGIAGAVAGVASGIAGVISMISKGLVSPLADTISGIAGTIGQTVTSLSAGLTKAIKGITLPVTKVIKKTIHLITAKITTIKTVIDGPATAILTPIKETLTTVKGVVDTIKAPVEAILEPVTMVRKTLSDIAELKVIGEILSGQRSMAELLGPIAEGKSVETAQAIAELYKSITGTTVAVMDKVDTEFELLAATIDTMDERIKANVSEQLALTKAEVMTIVTPRLDTLGRHQEVTLRAVARVGRHVEDAGWFAAMFLRMLR